MGQPRLSQDEMNKMDSWQAGKKRATDIESFAEHTKGMRPFVFSSRFCVFRAGSLFQGWGHLRSELGPFVFIVKGKGHRLHA